MKKEELGHVSKTKKDISLPLIAMLFLTLLIGGALFFMLPAGQKMLGKSLVVTSTNGYEIIYKGQTLMHAASNCVVQYSDGFSEIVVSCKDGSHKTWKNGELVK